MLKKLELTCFQKHEQLEVVFGQGLVCLRGSNEAGKSSVLRAISYALFGTKGVDLSLDELVTWGHKPNELCVRLHLDKWVIKRSKNGAEVTDTETGQPHVTGQTEVTAFCEKLLGCEAKVADSLMLSNQLGLRGILSSGPKATAMLIEDLAEFSLFDRLLDAAQHKLALGSPAMIESRIESLEKSLNGLGEPVRPDEAAMLATLERIGELQTQLSESLVKLQADLETADGKVRGAELIRNRHAELKRNIARVEKQIASDESDLSNLNLDGEIVDTTALEKQVADEEAFAERLAAYAKFQKLPIVEVYVERKEFDAANRARLARVKEIEGRKVELAKAIDVAKAKIQSGSCSFCGQDISSWPAVAERNAALQVEIDAATAERRELQVEYERLLQAGEGVDAIFDLENQILRGIRGIERWLDRDESVVPARFTWKGEVPDDGPRKDYAAELRQLRATNTRLTKARAQAEVLNNNLRKLRNELDGLNDALKELVLVSDDDEFDALCRELNALRTRVSTTKDEIRDLERQGRDVQAQFEREMEAHNRALELRDQFVAQIEQAKQEIQQLERNNLLVKKIRAARPTIGNKLWSLVLSSVSSIFSSMRGETSVVAKGKDGFTVNGKTVTSLSGSTLDLLGKAIRVALIKTFIPHCPLLVLDEPFASMDDARTQSALAYLCVSGFPQIILVTHEDVSQSIASNIIEL